LLECRRKHRQRHGLRRFAGFQADDAITLAAHGFDQRAAWPQLAAQIVDVDIDHVGVPRVARAPDPLQQRCAGDAAAAIEHQVFEQTELAAAQRNWLPPALERLLQAVQLQAATAQHGATILASDQRTAARFQLPHGEGLHHAVVCAHFQAGDAGFKLRALGRQDQDSHAIAQRTSQL
jgi:hypothetical protein